ncbi:F0F1 ATP synthase subunit epsilon [Acetonema longum]|uniref:ATP synthase epsilon chain n=1 Tax=Acetonema longum DSM 6540 TaxID=1009370 RepID=F7NIU2_9FIRM|nr:F0F1 ATP synthase subunit epsilon [Acetonema longum]EGO64065.1 F0F1 ATP synthase subunit epsilon [Acetonema longum DSM 6540]
MAKTFRLDIVTPERVLLSEEATMVVARAVDGDIGILPGHAPLITSLAIWPLKIKRADETEYQVSLCNGFMEVQPDKVTILAGCAELPAEIDPERARGAKARAESRLNGDRSDIDVVRAELALQRALVRLRVAGAEK